MVSRLSKYRPLLFPIVLLLLFCGCVSMEKIDPYQDSSPSGIILPDGAAITSSETTTEATTTTTTNAYTPPDDAQLRSVLEGMSVRQKAAQMILVSTNDEVFARECASEGAGGLCLFAAAFEKKDVEQVQAMTSGFQKAASVPLLISVDEEGGTVNRVSLNPKLRQSKFKSPKELYKEGGWGAIRKDTEEKAALLLTLGINSNLAPVCDIPITQRDYIAPRSFSTDTTETVSYVMSVVATMRDMRIGSTLKHFPGYGGSSDTHKGVGRDNRELSEFQQKDFKPFRAGIENGANSVMVSHNIVKCMDPDRPASLSPAVHRILREELQFRGVIISDDLGMKAITQYTDGQNPAVAAVLAGNDLLCYSDFKASVDAIESAVIAGEIEESRLDASVLRILYWKKTIGILK
ncbi:MAG: beta-hexosaminidase [Oscillospiraceae bacterium]|nr:beta-hexosaminidase [Oscillospiraceae bacterium]